MFPRVDVWKSGPVLGTIRCLTSAIEGSHRSDVVDLAAPEPVLSWPICGIPESMPIYGDYFNSSHRRKSSDFCLSAVTSQG